MSKPSGDDGDRQFIEELGQVRPVTRRLIEAVLADLWPPTAAVVNFGIDSRQHYEALSHPIRAGEIMPRALDEALGDGGKLTALARQAPSNPHPDVRFSNPWDRVLGRHGGRADGEAESAGLARQLFGGGHEPAPAPAEGNEHKTWAERVSGRPTEGDGDWLSERLRKLPDEQRQRREEDERGHGR
jgi:hypothetical protein